MRIKSAVNYDHILNVILIKVFVVVFLCQRPLVYLLLLGLPFFTDYSFRSTTLLKGMTGISLHSISLHRF
jgi:hypothetical protein